MGYIVNKSILALSIKKKGFCKKIVRKVDPPPNSIEAEFYSYTRWLLFFNRQRQLPQLISSCVQSCLVLLKGCFNATR